ncbi:hypothetical protein LXL04_020816 [Taraxacum kok-saghyz]
MKVVMYTCIILHWKHYKSVNKFIPVTPLPYDSHVFRRDYGYLLRLNKVSDKQIFFFSPNFISHVPADDASCVYIEKRKLTKRQKRPQRRGSESSISFEAFGGAWGVGLGPTPTGSKPSHSQGQQTYLGLFLLLEFFRASSCSS